MRATAITGLALLLATMGGLAQEAGKDQSKQLEDDLMSLLNTPITTASKKAERAIEAPSVVSVITRDQFQAYGWTSLNEALYSLPGFGPSQDYDRRTVSSRGLFEGWNNNHMLLLVDGIPYNDPIYGSAYTWEITPVFMVKTLEVVRGPGSALYGSNSTNSATQIKTITADSLPPGGQAQIRFGQRGERIWDFALGESGDLVSTVMAFNAYNTDGNRHMDYDGSARYDAQGKLQKFPVEDRRSSQYGWAKVDGVGALKGWSFQYHHQAWEYKTGHGWFWLAPDQGEFLQEKRQIAALSYKSAMGDLGDQEYMLSHQRHDLFWNLRFVPNDGFIWDSAQQGYAAVPNGVNELLDTGADNWFARGQWSFNLPKGASLLAGVETSRFLYEGDRTHYGINYDFNAYTTQVSGAVVNAGPWLEFIKDKPVTTTGTYVQFASGKMLGDHFTAVLGVRSDRTSFDFVDIYDAGRPTLSKRYSHTSPRVALIFMPAENLAIKAMFGSAFRSPAPSEFAGANTYTLASNIHQLEPETLGTTELAVDWIVNANLNWRTNIFRTKFSNQIAYSLNNANLSTNIYTLTTEGLETELLFGFASWKGYLNYSFARRVDEDVKDPTVAPSKDRLTWEPSSRFKAGVIYTHGDWTAAANLMHQGKVDRRSSDRGDSLFVGINVDPYRPAEVGAWFTLDAKVSYAFTRRTTLSLSATNLLDTDQNKLIKNMAFPFDYQGEGRKVSLALKTSF